MGTVFSRGRKVDGPLLSRDHPNCPDHATAVNYFGDKSNDNIHIDLPLTEERRDKRKSEGIALDDEVLEISSIVGRKENSLKNALYWILMIITFPIGFLFSMWYKKRTILLRSDPAPQATSDFLIIEGVDGSFEVCHVEELAVKTISFRHNEGAHVKYPKATSIPLERRMIIYRQTRFVYSASRGKYVLLEPGRNIVSRSQGKPSTTPSSAFPLDQENGLDLLSTGLTQKTAAERLTAFGENVIDIPIKHPLALLVEDVLSPFSVFQYFAVVLWYSDNYEAYATVILIISLSTSIIGVVFLVRSRRDMRRVAKFSCPVQVLRDGEVRKIESSELVPGDIVEIEADSKVTCDMALVQGTCVLNEALLTGESVVVIKSAVNSIDQAYDARVSNILFGGTSVVEVRVHKGKKVYAMVLRTGFGTVKGRLILSILYPKPNSFQFFQQAMRFVMALFVLAMIGFGINCWQMLIQGSEIIEVVFRGLDMITIVVPPALPLAMTVGIGFGIMNLKKFEILCIQPDRVNLAGKINCQCFDKTGTLTEEGLDLKLLHPCTDGSFEECTRDVRVLSYPLLATLASCHSLTHVKGEVKGDPLEMKTFEFTTSTLEEPHTMSEESGPMMPHHFMSRIHTHLNDNNDERKQQPAVALGVLVQFEFVPALQRMSVLTEDLATQQTQAFVKGSPEMIQTLCVPSSIPHDYDSTLSQYTRKGFRVLAAAHKTCDPSILSLNPEDMRQATESDLHFIGFIVMENKLKPQTLPTIRQLKNDAHIRCIMVTGDNVMTAVCVAKDCEISDNNPVFIVDRNDSGLITMTEIDDPNITLDPTTLRPQQVGGLPQIIGGSQTTNTPGTPIGTFRFAVTGKAFSHLLSLHKMGNLDFPFHRILMNSVVFARMAPENKAALIEELQGLGMYVGMVGDGANDSMALRQSHVGISLSEAEASVSAPFTCKRQNIECIPIVLREGRSALNTSFQLFRYMALYSFTQFCFALLIVFKKSFLSDAMFLWQDLFLVFMFSLMMGRTPASEKLTIKRPSGRLFSFYNLALTFSHIGVTIIFQVVVFLLVMRQPWFGTPAYPSIEPLILDHDSTNSAIPETTSVFFFCNFQYLCHAMLFSSGWPYKKGVHHNVPFFIWWLIAALCSGLLMFAPISPKIFAWVSIMVLPMEWRLDLLILGIFCTASYLMVEFIPSVLKQKRMCKTRDVSKLKPYRKLEREWKHQFSEMNL